MRRFPVFALIASLSLGGCAGTSAFFSELTEDKAEQRADASGANPAVSQVRAEPISGGAQQAAFTTRPGAVFQNSYGNTLSVMSVSGHYVAFRDQNGNDYFSYALLFTPDAKLRGNEDVMNAIDRLWPLAVGKTTTAWVYNGEWAWGLSWKVVGKERVTVPAGTYETWVVEHTEQSMGGGYVGKSRSWYAPNIGWNVRYRSWQDWPYSRKPAEEWVLTAVPRAAAAAR